jgi:hypothetical protein
MVAHENLFMKRYQTFGKKQISEAIVSVEESAAVRTIIKSFLSQHPFNLHDKIKQLNVFS